MAAPYTHGKDTVILLGTSSPAATDWSADIADSELGRERAVHENTTYGATAVGRQAGLRDNSFKMTVRINATNHATLKTYEEADVIYVQVRPLGTGTGKPKLDFAGFISSMPMPAPHDDILQRDVEVAVNGAITEGSQA